MHFFLLNLLFDNLEAPPQGNFSHPEFDFDFYLLYLSEVLFSCFFFGNLAQAGEFHTEFRRNLSNLVSLSYAQIGI